MVTDRTPKPRRVWTDAEKRVLADCIANRTSFEETARLLGRSTYQVKNHLHKTGVPYPLHWRTRTRTSSKRADAQPDTKPAAPPVDRLKLRTFSWERRDD